MLNENGRCSLLSDVAGTVDPNCASYDNGVCRECSSGFFLAPNHRCKVADPQCKEYSSGFCIACYSGYILTSDQICVHPNSLFTHIPFCDSYDSSGNCLECMNRYYLQEGNCHAVSILCKEYNSTTG